MDPLDNPIWAALRTHHAELAIMRDEAGRYPADVVPFAAAGTSSTRAAEELHQLVAPGESLYVLGLMPELGSGWTIRNHTALPQLVCASRAPVADGPDWVELTEAHRADMVALTTAVFPGFFRARTALMGRYIGIYDGGRLVAMAGERLRVDGYQEVSGVCTHPDFLGRGYAQRLVAEVSNAALERGFRPFLHVYRENVRAMAVYERLGYTLRKDLPFWHVTRDRR